MVIRFAEQAPEVFNVNVYIPGMVPVAVIVETPEPTIVEITPDKPPKGERVAVGEVKDPCSVTAVKEVPTQAVWLALPADVADTWNAVVTVTVPEAVGFMHGEPDVFTE